MKYILLLSFFLFSFSLRSQVISNNSDLPFTIEIEEIKNISLPGLHSFAFGKYKNWWIILGGRTNGLHGFFCCNRVSGRSGQFENYFNRPNDRRD